MTLNNYNIARAVTFTDQLSLLKFCFAEGPVETNIETYNWIMLHGRTRGPGSFPTEVPNI
jgi:hypothetical protein